MTTEQHWNRCFCIDCTSADTLTAKALGEGTWAVLDRTTPPPFGQTDNSYSVIVHAYGSNWSCGHCGDRNHWTTLSDCKHIIAAKKEAR